MKRRYPLVPLLMLAALMAATPACSRPVNGDAMSTASEQDAAWDQVRNAPDAQTQQQRLVAFLRAREAAGDPALQVMVYRRDSGAQAPIDDALWADPGQYDVELRLGERRYRFVPQSRASLEPLFEE